MRTPVRAGVGGVVLGLGRWNLGADEVAVGERGAGVEVGATGGGAGSSRYRRFFPSKRLTSHPPSPLESDQSDFPIVPEFRWPKHSTDRSPATSGRSSKRLLPSRSLHPRL
jgi:hypothetical protein